MLHKKLNVTETGSIVNDTTQSGGAAAGAAMTLLVKSGVTVAYIDEEV